MRSSSRAQTTLVRHTCHTQAYHVDGRDAEIPQLEEITREVSQTRPQHQPIERQRRRGGEVQPHCCVLCCEEVLKEGNTGRVQEVALLCLFLFVCFLFHQFLSDSFLLQVFSFWCGTHDLKRQKQRGGGASCTCTLKGNKGVSKNQVGSVRLRRPRGCRQSLEAAGEAFASHTDTCVPIFHL